MPLDAGTRLGPYEILAPLGQGGMGEVYRARDPRLGRDIAIKVLPPHLSGDADFRARFEREARSIAALNHVGICALYDVGAHAGIDFLVMELVDGQPLAGPLPAGQALPLALQIVAALEAAHARGVIHRDLKPANILVTATGIKLLDFGLAKLTADEGAEAGSEVTRTQVGTILGTAAYMSPEQAAGGSGDARSDLFSFGAVLYELLSGRRPFPGETAVLVMAAVLQREPEPLRGMGALEPIVLRCLRKSPADRFQTAAELRRALTAAGETPIDSAASIAVLPFVNMSADPEDEFFADGITEEIINALAQIKGLRVTARTSSFAFKGKNEDLRVVAERLGVGLLLEGSVRRAASRLRVTAQLIHAADGCHLWSERYDRELLDVFAIQDEIAGAIAAKLEVALSGRGAPRPAPANLEAYDLLFKGRALLARRGRSIADAQACFQRALDLDPGLAEAHALLGDTYRLLALYGIAPADQMVPRARAAAESALALDPDQVEALATVANLTAVYDWDVAASMALSERALARDPSHVRTLCERAVWLSLLDSPPPEMEQALLGLHQARAIDPLSSWVAAMNAFCHGFAGHLEVALGEARRAVALDPENFAARWSCVWILAACNRHGDALAEAERALLMSGRNARILTEVAALHAALGDSAACEAVHQELRSRASTGYVPWAEQAAAAASAGHLDEARALLTRAVAAHESYLAFWKLPAWAPLRGDPEGLELLLSNGFSRLKPRA